MSSSKDVKEFPDLSNKLAAPKKQSLFERQKADAEAKRIREEAETAAVYEDFVKSFEDEGGSGPPNYGAPRERGGFATESRAPSGPAKRHFTSSSSQRVSGPGSLGPPNLVRKRAMEGPRGDKGKEKGIFAFEDSRSSGPIDTATAFQTSDDEDEKVQENNSGERVVAKHTLHLSSLPPDTSIPVIKKLLTENLVVDSIRVLPPPGPGSLERRSMSVIVAFAQDTPASDLDATVSSLQNKYLGWGYNLSISRHLSSATLGSMTSSLPITPSSRASLPFGAKPIPFESGPTLSRAPPPGSHRGGFAPPSSYGPSGVGPSGRNVPPLLVKVVIPTDLRQLRLIHKTVEDLLKHGPEFEALLMNQPQVQSDEKWAWLFNARSQGGVYYRWRLWEILAGDDAQPLNQHGPRTYEIFPGMPPWQEPDQSLPFEFTTKFEDLVSDSDYNSSAEDDSDEEGAARLRRRHFDKPGGPRLDTSAAIGDDEQSYLNPLRKAKLVHLLARLPITTARLRKGDVARVTTFAITHAGHGADEIVDMLISNVIHPLSRSKTANPDLKRDNADADVDGGDSEDKRDREDVSSSTLIGLHLISDILSASSNCGVRHAWRYRALFEAALQTRNVFAYLGRMEKELGWGRMRADKWRRAVSGVLELWEGWSVFPGATHVRLAQQFNNPPLTEEEAAAESEKKVDKPGVKDVAKSKWKSVDVNAAAEEDPAPAVEQTIPMDVDTDPRKDEVAKEVAVVHTEEAPVKAMEGEPMEVVDEKRVANKRRRPKAEDMFADSEED